VAALSRSGRRRARGVCFVGIAACYVASVPWYRTGGAEPAIVAGLPDWVAFALGCYVAAGALNAVAWWLADVDDGPGGTPDGSQ
jgi:hypothetical protein